jgi:hypothetical protein
MNTDKTNNPAPNKEQPDMVKKIGKTTYHVKAHFNPNSKETMSDKIMRLLRSEASRL